MDAPVVDYATTGSIAYFSLNLLLLLAIALKTKKLGGKTSCGQYLKNTWAQRSIYSGILVHIYDISTDIGVAINWYYLMKQEEANDYDFVSIDMKSFFWSSIAIIAFNRVFQIFYIMSDAGEEYLPKCKRVLFSVMALFDLYILRTVHCSISGANIKIRSKLQRAGDTANQNQKQKPLKLNNLKPCAHQRDMQLFECMFEAIPQLLLQSVFVIRSDNDPELRRDANMILLLFSISASILCISNKYIAWDKDMNVVADQAKEIKCACCVCPCMNVLYIERILWRSCHILNRFVLLALIWSVIGGVFLVVAFSLTLVVWIAAMYREDNDIRFALKCGVTATVGMVTGVERIHLNILRWIENICWFVSVVVFITNSFSCSICANPCYRMIMEMDDAECEWKQNMAVLTFLSLVSVSLVLEFVLWIHLNVQGLLSKSYYVRREEEERREINVMDEAVWMTYPTENKNDNDSENEYVMTRARWFT